jgi:putative PIN family toxin of toxin-antitoxin system
MLVVIDTNILVSALISPSGKEAHIASLVVQQTLLAAVSESILAEYEAVLTRSKFNFNPAKVTRILYPLRSYSLMVKPTHRLTVSPDDSDNRFLECAEAASADFLITGNKRHFPDNHRVTTVLTAREFLADITTR